MANEISFRMRWVITMSIVLVLGGTSLLLYASKLPVYSDSKAPARIADELQLKPDELKSIGARTSEWYSRLRLYETPQKRISDLGRGLCAAGIGLLLASWLWRAYHRYPWVRRTRSMLVIWLALWALRFPLSMWYYGLRSYRLDYPPWADSIGGSIFLEWIAWIVGALVSSLALVWLLPEHPLPASIRLVRPTSRSSWIRISFVGCWIATLGACVAFGIPDGDEGEVVTCIMAAVVLLAFSAARKVAPLNIQPTAEFSNQKK